MVERRPLWSAGALLHARSRGGERADLHKPLTFVVGFQEL